MNLNDDYLYDLCCNTLETRSTYYTNEALHAKNFLVLICQVEVPTQLNCLSSSRRLLKKRKKKEQHLLSIVQNVTLQALLTLLVN